MAHIIKQNIAKIIGLPGNNRCSDCGVEVDNNNGWASMTFGTIICVECAGAHRNIPGNQIRSFLLDTMAWTDNKNVDFLSKIGGNTAANNNVWECHLPYFCINPKRERLDEFCDRDKSAKFRRLFIQNKYENQLFIPLSQNDYFTDKNQAIIKVPLDPMSQKRILLFNVYGKKKWSKKALFICVHSNYLSIYSNNKIKKKKCDHIKSFDLIPLQITLHLTDPYDDDEDVYEFQIIKAADNKEEEKEQEYNPYDDDDDDDNIILRGRVKDFDLFCKIVHELRKTIAYYRMYTTLVNIDDIEIYPIKKAIDCAQLKQSKQYVGCGKLFGGTLLHFYVVSDVLYTFKDNPLLATKGELHAQHAWNLLKIDLQQDLEGIRTGIKNSVMIVEPFKLLSVKFDKERGFTVFYHKLRKLWRQTRGNYLCDFQPKIPVIMDENKEKDDISFARSPRSSIVDRLDFSRVKSMALKKERPPEILEILAKIENIDVEPLPVEEAEEEEEEAPPEAPVMEHKQTFEKMKEMHRKMSTPLLKAQKSPAVAPNLPKLNEAINPIMQDMNLDESNESKSLPKIGQESVALALEDDNEANSALNSYQKARMRQRRKRKQTAPMLSLNNNKSSAAGMDVNVNKAFMAGLKMKKKMLKMRKRVEADQKPKAKAKAVLPPPNPVEVQRGNNNKHVHKQVKSQDLYEEQKQMQLAKEMRKSQKAQARSMDYGNMDFNAKMHQNMQPQKLPNLQNMQQMQQNKQNLQQQQMHRNMQPQQQMQPQQMHQNPRNLQQNMQPQKAENLQNLQQKQQQMPPNLYDNKSGSPSNPSMSPLMQSRSSEAQPMNIPLVNPMNPVPQRWNCKLCTYENKAADGSCAICGAKRKLKEKQLQNNNAAAIPQQRASGVMHSMSMSMNMYQQQQQQRQPQQMQQAQDSTMLMLFHQQEFQKFFQQQQFPQNMNRTQLQQVQQMANYHYQQYMMLYQRYQQTSVQGFMQQQSSLTFIPQQQQQLLQPQQQQRKVKKRVSAKKPQKQNKKLLQKRKAGGFQMQYIKLERYFLMNENQKNDLSVNSYAIQQSMAHLGRLEIVNEINCYKVTIAANIPLPRRKAHWQNVLKMIRECIGMSMEHIVQ